MGHDEYWSASQRANVEAARDAGVHLAFLSGNEIFWKTRWEASSDATATPYRTLVSYKETSANARIDPLDPPTWTGTWRDPRFSPPADGARPENSLSGQMSTVDRGSAAITVSSAYSALRFWRNTSVATLTSGQTATLATQTIGYEWDEDLDNGSRPAGLMQLSSTFVPTVTRAVDFGNTYVPSSATHALTLYRHSSGALVFAAGSVQYVWGLDPNHDVGVDSGAPTADGTIQQATINLLADMGVQPTNLQPSLVPATASWDITPPTSTITSPPSGGSVASGSGVTVTGTAGDADGAVATVEVSVDGGTTWHRATGRQNWTYSWRPGELGTATIMSRAADDSGNLESPSTPSVVSVAQALCPCTIWDDTTTPWWTDVTDTTAQELGVKFQSDVPGVVTGIRFYKSAANIGTHVGHLWSASGTLLAAAIFTGESASGWQRVDFSPPVAIAANTTYTASYHTDVGHYAADTFYFGRSGVDQWPLHAMSSASSNGNGVFAGGTTGVFPGSSYFATNYWVDVVFSPNTQDTTPPTVSAMTPGDGATDVTTRTAVTATVSELIDVATLTSSTFFLRDPSNAIVSSSISYNASTSIATLTPAQPLAATTIYTATIVGSANGVKDAAGNPLAGNRVWSFTTGSSTGCPCTIWDASTVPANTNANDPNPQELGVKFTAGVDGTITGIRFYKGPTNTGTHVGNLWSSTGTLLATATFTAETASGWQQVNFATPVSIMANATYVASYHTNAGNPSYNSAYFTSAGVDRAPLHTPSAGAAGGNGVYIYGASAFPTQSYNANNYWVDVVFSEGASGSSDSTGPTCPCSIWNGSTVPANANANDPNPQELGVKFTTDTDGTITGVRFYKGPTNTGTHVGNLWTSAGALLASATFTGETASGWQQVNFAAPVNVTANTTYVASYHTNAGNPSYTAAYFATGVGNGPLHALSAGAAGGNGVYSYGASAFQTQTYNANNYWVDVVFTNGGPDTTPPTVSAVTPTDGATDVATSTVVTATFSEAINASTAMFVLRDPASNTVASTVTYDASSRTATLTPTQPLALSTNYTATITGGANGVKDLAGNVMTTDRVWSFTTDAGSSCPCTIWRPSVVPANANANDPSPQELGVKFTSDTSGTITGIRFYKGPTNTGTHIGNLWTSSGTLLATATFTGETASGWQQVDFATPVAITANTTYVASYHSNAGNPSYTSAYFASGGIDSGPLHVPTSGVSGGNGVYIYGGSAFPTQTYNANNYWVDVVFTNGAPPPPGDNPVSIWSTAASPSKTQFSAGAVELGLKFRSDVNGTITSVRFYKAAGEIGTHVANLWTSAGVLLATATFSNETASGWQTVDFATPVAITANTIYVVSYHTNTGTFAYDRPYFAGSGVDAPPLHALADGVSGNGVFIYGATSAFPTQSYSSSNYWVDVLFVAQ